MNSFFKKYLNNPPANFSWITNAEFPQFLNEFAATKECPRFDVNLAQQAASLRDRKEKNGSVDIELERQRQNRVDSNCQFPPVFQSFKTSRNVFFFQ
jgi:hypothetical protein